MKCRICKKEYKKNDMYCPHCGAAVSGCKRTWLAAAAAIAATAVVGGAVLLACYDRAPAENPVPSPSQESQYTATADQTTRTESTATTASTTATQTTAATTGANQTEELRRQLVSHKWNTKVMGFSAQITFNNNGSAQVTLNMLFVKETLPGRYTLGSDNAFVLEFSYGGEDYRLSGTVERVGEKKLIVRVGSEQYTLTAAD